MERIDDCTAGHSVANGLLWGFQIMQVSATSFFRDIDLYGVTAM